jgi:hypothetical protein
MTNGNLTSKKATPALVREADRRRLVWARTLVGSFLVGGALLPGCELLTGVDNAMPPGACPVGDECPSGYVCVDAFCRLNCATNVDCPQGEVCTNEEPGRICTGAPDAVDSGSDVSSPVVLGDAMADEVQPLPANDMDAGSIDSPTTLLTPDAVEDDSAPDAGPDAEAGPEASDGGCQEPSNILLFGGQKLTPTSLADTWEWNGTSWAQVAGFDAGASADAGTSADAGDAPAARWLGGMGDICGKPMLFGGQDNVNGFYGDQWTWTGTGWIKTYVIGASPPPVAIFASGVLDENFVVFGGATDATDGSSDTWVFSNSMWTREPLLTPPPGRSEAALASFNGSLVMFGGVDINGFPLADAYQWNGLNWLPFNAPPTRYAATAAALGNKIVVFGGTDEMGNIVDDTLVWDGIAWQNPMPAVHPTARYFASAATLGNSVVLYGGNDGQVVLDDTWIWDGSTWTDTMQPGPPARQGAAMTSF